MNEYVITYGFDLMRGGIRITGTYMVEARDADEAHVIGASMCSRTERVLWVDEFQPFEDEDLLDYESIEVI